MALDVKRPANYRRAWSGGRDLTKKPLTAAEWNQQYPVGTEVIVVKDDGSMWQTKTRSEAWELGHGQSVVALEGKSGGYDLSRVAPTGATPTKRVCLDCGVALPDHWSFSRCEAHYSSAGEKGDAS